jgi:CelD/BcsL family acetyltransferase involved in cellulose biosynthesis
MKVCSVLSEERDVEALAPLWRDLHRRIGLAPYTDYDWAMVWWKTIGKPEGARLYVAACHDGDRLVGVLPLTVRDSHGVRVLRLLGHEAYYYRNFLIETDDIVRDLWDWILRSGFYDMAMIKNIHEGTPHQDYWQKKGCHLHTSHVYHAALSGQTREQLVKSKSKPFQRKHRTVEKKLAELPSLMVEHFYQDKSYPNQVIEFLVKRKKAWTEERGKRGVFNEANVMSFYQEMTRLGSDKGTLFLNWMREGDNFCGVTLNFIEKTILYGHTLTIDPTYAKYMPGIYLNTEAIIWASENGFKEVNFMEGEEEYKKRFAKESRVIHEYAYARTLRGYLFLQSYKLLCLIRRVRNKAR